MKYQVSTNILKTPHRLTSEEDSSKEQAKKSFLYRDSVSPPKKKMKKVKPAKKDKNDK